MRRETGGRERQAQRGTPNSPPPPSPRRQQRTRMESNDDEDRHQRGRRLRRQQGGPPLDSDATDRREHHKGRRRRATAWLNANNTKHTPQRDLKKESAGSPSLDARRRPPPPSPPLLHADAPCSTWNPRSLSERSKGGHKDDPGTTLRGSAPTLDQVAAILTKDTTPCNRALTVAAHAAHAARADRAPRATDQTRTAPRHYNELRQEPRQRGD